MRFTKRMLGVVMLALSVVACGGAGGEADTEQTASAQSETAQGIGFYFALYPITVAVTGPGKVVGSPGVIDCGDGGSVCTDKFKKWTSVTLTASPTAGMNFLGWGGSCSGQATTCTINNSAARSVTAQFGAPSAPPVVNYTLSIVAGQGGRVTSSPAGIDCGGTTTQCNAPYANGTNVTLTAQALSGYQFVGWSGTACSGTTATCTVSMNAAKAATASFTPAVVQHTIQLTWTGSSDTAVSGYKVYHGIQAGTYTDGGVVSSASSTYTTTGSGTHYFAVSAVSATGQESARSAEVSVLIP